jgi:hypothetical protein
VFGQIAAPILIDTATKSKHSPESLQKIIRMEQEIVRLTCPRTSALTFLALSMPKSADRLAFTKDRLFRSVRMCCCTYPRSQIGCRLNDSSGRIQIARQVNDYLPLSRRDPLLFEGPRRAWKLAFDRAGAKLEDLLLQKYMTVSQSPNYLLMRQWVSRLSVTARTIEAGIV